jgi:hypothetical protein
VARDGNWRNATRLILRRLAVEKQAVGLDMTNRYAQSGPGKTLMGREDSEWPTWVQTSSLPVSGESEVLPCSASLFMMA